MYIDTLKLTNFKRFESLELNLDEKINVFIGINGAGKTSILKSVVNGLGPLVFYWAESGLGHPNVAEIVHKRVERAENRVRLEPVYPVEICLLIKDGGVSFPLSVSYQADNDKKRQWVRNYNRPKGFGHTLPVLALYGAERFTSNCISDTIQPSLRPEERLRAYDSWSNASASQECMKTLSWIATKSTERMQIALESETSYAKVVGDDLATLNQALRSAFEEFESIYYDWKSKSILTLWQGGQVKTFEDLSDGERGVVLLFADIVRRVALLNPHLGGRAARETDCVVLIDEIDAHLHPAWQQKIVPGLNKAFPKIQFIVSTHSPFVVGEVKPSSIFMLTEKGIQQPLQSYGLNNDEINLQLFQTTGQNKEVREKVEQIQSLIEADKFKDAQEGIESLEKLLNGASQDTRDLEMQLKWAKTETDL